MKKHLIFYTVLAVFGFSSCKTARQLTKKTTLEVNPVAELTTKVLQAEPRFRNANVSSMGVSVDIGNHNYNARASCKIKKDTAVYVSIQVLGIEMFKVELTPDSMHIFDKLNLRHYATDYPYFEQKLGVAVDYHSLQSLISNQYFKAGTLDTNTDSCTLNISGGKKVIEFVNLNMKQATTLGDDNRIQQIVLNSKKTNYELTASYSGFAVIDSVSFPQKIDIHAANNVQKMNFSFTISKAAFNAGVNLIPVNPARYTRVSIDHLLRK